MTPTKIIVHKRKENHKKDACPICGGPKDTRSKRCGKLHRTTDDIRKVSREWAKNNPVVTKNRCLEFARKRRAWLSAYKASIGCVICGEKDPRCLDFHHRDPTTKIHNVSHLINSMDAMLKEMDKCDLLCANCHRKLGRNHEPD